MLTVTYIAKFMNMPTQKKRITMKDVAEAAGVSTQTVSRVINDFSYVSDHTRQKVKTVIEELGYLPSTLARSLSQQRSFTIGVVTYGLKHMGPSRTLNGIADVAEKLGYMLLMKELQSFETKTINGVIASLLSRQVDGIIWAAPEIGNSHIWLNDQLDSITVPALFLTMEPRKGLSSVETDNYQGAVLAMQHLLDSGRRKIVHISGPLTWWEATERKRGWHDTLKKAGLSAPDRYIAEGNWSAASGKRAFLQLYEAYPDMDAIFVANDQMALSVLREAHRLNIRIPEQLAVVGYDNIEESAYFYPSLTTISQDHQLIGETAVQTLIKMIKKAQKNQPAESHAIVFEPTLIVRESSVVSD